MQPASLPCIGFLHQSHRPCLPMGPPAMLLYLGTYCLGPWFGLGG